MSTLTERFTTRLRPQKNGCWHLALSKGSHGYPQISVDGRQQVAHRVSYELFIGPIPEGMTIHHSCMNKGCVNPDHLVAMTHVENISQPDGMVGIQTIQTHCPSGHEYAGENLYIDPKGYRRCRACNRERARRRREKE